jgi:hypothetical protein
MIVIIIITIIIQIIILILLQAYVFCIFFCRRCAFLSFCLVLCSYADTVTAEPAHYQTPIVLILDLCDSAKMDVLQRSLLSIETCWNDKLKWKMEAFGKDHLPYRHFVHTNATRTTPELQPDLSISNMATNRLSYGKMNDQV